MERFICIHGHFYQPPRENPWLEAIEQQDSSYPFHDWNARITAECYGPNATSRILSGDGRIVDIVNNYSKISFNFGPTILAWLEHKEPNVYAGILAADRESRARFGGHGSAIAQAYNHMIMPLATPRDRRTQVRWGLRDFERRFGRRAEGMWLPETAVCTDSLEALAEHGVRFTILEPGQATRVRRLGRTSWSDVSGGRIDPTRPYLMKLPSGREIVLFFYDGPISRGVAFERLLGRGEWFAGRILGAFNDSRDWPQIVHIATDGETYGHHHPHGDMALAYALRHIEDNGLAKLTNYAEYLERFPPTHEVQIGERTAWSCAHGVGRWERDCGCNSGGHAGWNQAWREPLRDALDWLRDTVASSWEERARALLRDPWAARDGYIDVVLDRAPVAVARFLRGYAAQPLSSEDSVKALQLLELQRHAMLMYTSCGWFFDELSGIETVQVIQYAGRVVQLARVVLGMDVEEGFLSRLERAKSNITDHGDGRRIYEKFVRPSTLDLEKVCAHFALATLFEGEPNGESPIYCYTVLDESRRSQEAGAARIVVGKARVTSRITSASEVFSYGAVYMGDHNVTGGVRIFGGDDSFEALAEEAVVAFHRVDFPRIIRLFDRAFGAGTVTLRSLFRDEQRRVVERMLKGAIRDAEVGYRQLYEQRAPLLRFLSDVGMPIPRALLASAEVVLNSQLRRLVRADRPNARRVYEVLEQAREGSVPLDAAGIAYDLHETVVRAARALQREPESLQAVRRFGALVRLAQSMPFEVPLWEAQNVYWETLRAEVPRRRALAAGGDPVAQEWLDAFTSVAGPLSVSLREVPS